MQQITKLRFPLEQTACPAEIQVSQPFELGLLDYYGNVGVAENGGSCTVQYHLTDNITVPDLGRSSTITAGLAAFDVFSIIGKSQSGCMPASSSIFMRIGANFSKRFSHCDPLVHNASQVIRQWLLRSLWRL